MCYQGNIFSINVQEAGKSVKILQFFEMAIYLKTNLKTKAKEIWALCAS